MSNRQFESTLPKLRNLAIVSGVLAAAAIAVVSPASANGVKPWNIQSVVGDVKIKTPGGNWVAAKSGADVAPGSEIKTSESGRAVITQGGDVVEASPNSGAVFPKRESSSLPSVVQSAGTLLYKIVSRPSDRFNVKTPYLTAVIKGTVFSVTVNNEGGALHVTRGAVEVTSRLTGEIAMVKPGQTAAVSTRPGLRMQLLGTQGGSKDSKESGDKQGKAKGDDAKSSSKADAGRVIGNPVGSAGSGQAKGLSKSVNAGKVDVLSASKGLIGGPGQGNGNANAGSARGNSERGNSQAGGSPNAASVAASARGSISANGGGNGAAAASNNGGGNGGGNSNGNSGNNSGGNGGGNGNGNGNN